MSRLIASLSIMFVFFLTASAHAGGRAYINGKLVEEKPVPKVTFKEGDFIINKKGLKHEVILELGWGDGDYEVGFDDSEGVVNAPGGLAVDKHGNIFVGDSVNGRILVYGADGKLVRKIEGPSGSKMVIGQDGKIYCFGPYSLREIDKDGNILRELLIRGYANNNVMPKSIIIKGGDIYLGGPRGFQKITGIQKKETRWGERLYAKLGELEQNYPYNDCADHKGQKMSDIDPEYSEYGLGDVTGIPINTGKGKARPLKLFRKINRQGVKVLHVFDKDGYGTYASVRLYGDRTHGEEIDALINVDEDNNIYQLFYNVSGIEVVRWGN